MTDNAPVSSPDLLSEQTPAAPTPKRRRASVRKRGQDAVDAGGLPNLLLLPVNAEKPGLDTISLDQLHAAYEELCAIDTALAALRRRLIPSQA